VTGNNKPTTEGVKQGVPKGCVLGPTWFLLYTNDLPAVINKKAILDLFADDTSILCADCNDTSILYADCNDTSILCTDCSSMEFHLNIETVLGNVNSG
jgi:hypothetical protein